MCCRRTSLRLSPASAYVVLALITRMLCSMTCPLPLLLILLLLNALHPTISVPVMLMPLHLKQLRPHTLLQCRVTRLLATPVSLAPLAGIARRQGLCRTLGHLSAYPLPQLLRHLSTWLSTRHLPLPHHHSSLLLQAFSHRSTIRVKVHQTKVLHHQALGSALEWTAPVHRLAFSKSSSIIFVLS